MTTVNCMYCGIEGVHPGTLKCTDGEACGLRMDLEEANAHVEELTRQRDELAKLVSMLRRRLATHDFDCSVTIGKACNCGALAIVADIDATLAATETRLAREGRLRALGFEDVTDEQREWNIATSLLDAQVNYGRGE